MRNVTGGAVASGRSDERGVWIVEEWGEVRGPALSALYI